MNLLATNPELWNALSAIGSILGAVATLAAVIVALRLARRDLQPRLRVASRIMRGIGPGEPTQYFCVTGTNVGHIPITVQGVYWTYRRFRKVTLVALPKFTEGSTSLPVELSHGQQVELNVCLIDFQEQAMSIAEELVKERNPFRAANTLQCGLYTSIGKDFAEKAGDRVREMVVEKIRELHRIDPQQVEDAGRAPDAQD